MRFGIFLVIGADTDGDVAVHVFYHDAKLLGDFRHSKHIGGFERELYYRHSAPII